MIDDLFQAGTDAVLNDMVQRPKPPPKPAGPSWYTGLASSPIDAFRVGGAKAVAFGAEISGAFGSVAGAYPEGFGAVLTPAQQAQAETARQDLLKSGPTYSNPAGDAFRQSASDWTPDPKTTGKAAQLVVGMGSFATEIAASTLAAGPLAPLGVGGMTGFDTADELKQQGVDLETRAKAGAVAGVTNAAMVAVPMTAATRLGAAAKGVAIGEGATVGQTAAIQTILKHDGYDKIADRYDPFDPTALAVGLVPGVFGWILHGGKPNLPAEVSAKTESDVKNAVQLSPVEQAKEAAYEASPANLRELQAAIDKEKNPASKALLEQEMATQQHAAAAVKADPDLVPAARVLLASDAMDGNRLTDGSIAGRNQHDAALRLAGDQLGAGDAVDVSGVLDRIDPARMEDAASRVKIPEEPAAPLTDQDIINPIDVNASPEEKVAQLGELTRENQPIVQDFTKKLDDELGTSSKDNVKAPENILAKAQRPSILAEKPWHDVEHIRDSYRFKTVLDNLDQLPEVVGRLRQMGATIVKTDVSKVIDPKEFGWRISAFDLRMPNGQLVEHYAPVKELEAAKKNGGHQLFEEARVLDLADPAQRAKYQDLAAQSRAHYEAAWQAYLARTGSDATAVRASLDKARAAAGASEVKPSAKSPALLEGAGEAQTPATLRAAENEAGPKTNATGEPLSATKASAESGADAIGTSGASVNPKEAAGGAAGPAFEANLAKLEASAPDMPVQLEGGERTTLKAALESIRAQFAADTADAKLAQVAAECFLRAG